VAGNFSEMTNAFKILKDTVPPQQITNLTAQAGPLRGSVELSWSVPFDLGSGVELYQVFYSSYSNFTTSTTVIAYTNSLVITGLDVDTTYYFRLRTKDKLPSPPNPYPNWSGLSNIASCRPQKGNIWINEIYCFGSSGNDWVELYNSLPFAVSLNGWQLRYAGNTVWTGTTEVIQVSSCIVISGLSFEHTLSTSIVLLNPSGIVVSRVIYPSHNIDVSYSRITDGNATYFEFDPSPTKGLTNTTTEYAYIKINEVHYSSSEQFIELFNTSYISTITFTGYLRNTNNKIFKFTRKLYPRCFTMIDFSSTDNDGFSFFDRFGVGGLKTTSDFVVLENNLGQTIDRLTYQTPTVYIYRNETATLTSFVEAQQGNISSGNSLSRSPDGVDSDIDNLDFVVQAKTYGSRNILPNLVANLLNYPINNSVIPRKFKFDIKFSTDYTKGLNNVIYFVRIGGKEDFYSPHIYRLDELGFDLSNYLVFQSTTKVGLEMLDIDGYTLSSGTVYRMILNTETDLFTSPQIVVSSITYDGTIHSIKISSFNLNYANEDKYYPLFKISLRNNSILGSKIYLDSLYMRFTDKDNSPLSTQQARNLFSGIYLFKDVGEKEFYPFEDIIVAQKQSLEFNLNTEGKDYISLDFIDEVQPQTENVYFLTVKISSFATEVFPDTFKTFIKEGVDTLWRETLSDVVQPYIEGFEVVCSTFKIVRPLKPPIGTNWPYRLDKNINNITITNTNQYLVFCENGGSFIFSNAGVILSSFTADSGVISSILGEYFTGESGVVYFATKSGKIYKNSLSDISQNIWIRDLSKNITSDILGYYYELPAKIYVGSQDGYIFKISTAAFDLWTPPVQILGTPVKLPSIDEGFTSGVSSLWWGTSFGYIYRISLQDGSILSSLYVSSPVSTSIEYDSGFYNQSLNSLNIYFATIDGKVICRYGLNLNQIPPGWEDVVLNTRIYNMAFDNINKLLYLSCENGIYKINASNGSIIWHYPTHSAVENQVYIWRAIIGSPYIYFTTKDGLLYSIHKDTKQLQPGYPIFLGSKPTNTLTYDFSLGRIIIGTSDGGINVFKE
ncbi:MAG: lamin tail domain-containing protein, partial [Elusimicrobiota bacterium]|nr:lamin tail domain-containing protein [Endomicrobiia bacterium]MDW8165166.1 lamin tail domain-containing protein [Elusimicrobiota bacterium]